MTEVLLENFEELFPRIEKALKNAKFISLDTEFTALYTTLNDKQSLFDSPRERYNKLRQTANKIIPIQIGLTAFTFDRDSIHYKGETFTFYIWPRPYRNLNHTILFTASSFQFLCRHKFDFNKLIYHGIPFLNSDQEKLLMEQLLFTSLTTEEGDTEHDLEEIMPLLSTWFYKSEVGATYDLSDHFCDQTNIESLHIVQKYIRNRFQGVIWTYIENEKFIARKVSKEEYLELSKQSDLDVELQKKLLGFTRIFRLLIEAKKPLVGHNLFMDLLLLYNTFEKPLPNNYTDFKDCIHKIFPSIYDTKTLSFNVRKLIPRNKEWTNSSLPQLYEYFKDSFGRHIVMNSPLIEMINPIQTDHYHNAGFDSYCTGYIFIRIAHIFCMNRNVLTNREVTSTEHFAAVDQFKNEINLIRSTVSSIQLDGKDPKSTRPPCLIVKSITISPINMAEVSSSLSSYGNVEIKPFSHNQVIVAVDNYSSAKRIYSHFNTNPHFSVQPYSVIKHSRWGKCMLLGGVILSIGVLYKAAS